MSEYLMETDKTSMKLLTLKELSAVSGVAKVTIRRYVKRGKIVSFQPGGPRGKLLFPPDALKVVVRPTTPIAAEPDVASSPTTDDRIVDKMTQRDSGSVSAAAKRPRSLWRRNLPTNLKSMEN